jgi:heme A synthase
MLGHAAWRRSPARLAHALLALLAIEMALGLLLVIGDLPLLIAVAHNLTAAMLLAVTWQLSRESGTQGLPPLADDKRLD